MALRPCRVDRCDRYAYSRGVCAAPLRALAPLAYAREILIRYAGSTVDPDASE